MGFKEAEITAKIKEEIKRGVYQPSEFKQYAADAGWQNWMEVYPEDLSEYDQDNLPERVLNNIEEFQKGVFESFFNETEKIEEIKRIEKNKVVEFYSNKKDWTVGEVEAFENKIYEIYESDEDFFKSIEGFNDKGYGKYTVWNKYIEDWGNFEFFHHNAYDDLRYRDGVRREYSYELLIKATAFDSIDKKNPFAVVAHYSSGEWYYIVDFKGLEEAFVDGLVEYFAELDLKQEDEEEEMVQ